MATFLPRSLARGSCSMAVLLACAAAPAIGQVRYVDAARPADGDGTSWATAFKSLQSALTTAGTVTQIWVARGTYTPAATDRTASFTMRSNLAILGGFAGTESSAAQRDPAANVTVLSGDLAGNDPAQPGENSVHVVVASSVVSSAVLDGFTIRGGYTAGSVPLAGPMDGAGLFAINGSPTIVRCRFVDNNCGNGVNVGCTSGSGSGGSGGSGGAAFFSGGSPVFRQCVFINNRAGSGGGGTTCTFGGSGGGGGRGGAVATLGASATFINCFFAGNAAGGGGSGGGTTTGGGSSGGTAGDGGAISFSASSGTPTLDLLNCVFSGNRAGRGGFGGSGPFGAGGAGGAAGNGGAVALSGVAGANVRMINCTLSGGAAVQGGTGGSGGSGGFPAGAAGAPGRSGAIYVNGPSTTITGSILWNNTDPSGAGAQAQLLTAAGSTSVTYSDVQGGAAGTGNIAADPLFVAPAGPDTIVGTGDDDLSLGTASPCIDAADTAALLAGPAFSFTDIAGRPRAVDLAGVPDTGAGLSPLADMGAYETQPCAADFNKSGGLSVQDIFDFLGAWFAGCP